RNSLMLGVKGGVNYSTGLIQSGMPVGIQSKAWMCGGVQLSIPYSRYLGLQPELLLGERGFDATGILNSQSYSFTRCENVVDVPLFIAFKPGPFISILAGPQYTRLFKCDDRFTVSEMAASGEQVNLNTNPRLNNFCLAAGFDVNIQYMLLGFRIACDTQKTSYDRASLAPAYRNAWLQFTFGYRY
ncbi:MAG TPA: outer membrane beta-barrel protein, partial [Bacteroidia bacterium]|nr:outer membrane beta-barrel protein [Bacteroidia bacterium]